MSEFAYEGMRCLSPAGEWCVHSYYTLSPYAPDGSGRILLSGADLDGDATCVYIVSPDGEVLARFGEGKPDTNFYHTGSWQTWSPDARYVYYQGGDMKNPQICRYEVATGEVVTLAGDMEGAPPQGEPIISGFLGMLYAAGYGDGHYHPENAPIPFAARDKHGLFRFSPEKGTRELALSVNDILAMHPDREKILAAEREFIANTGHTEGFTLMAYCVRWSHDGDRCLFYFGNHCVDRRRGEPKLSYVFTAKRDLTDIHFALDMSFGRTGVHWGWHPDGEHLVGYASHPDNDMKMCLCSVRYDGSDFRMISRHASGGHPSISPVDYNLLVADESTDPGRVVFIDLATDTEIGAYVLPRTYGDKIPMGRNPQKICHHPVFRKDGKKIILNVLPDRNSVVVEMDVIERK